MPTQGATHHTPQFVHYGCSGLAGSREGADSFGHEPRHGLTGSEGGDGVPVGITVEEGSVNGGVPQASAQQGEGLPPGGSG